MMNPSESDDARKTPSLNTPDVIAPDAVITEKHA